MKLSSIHLGISAFAAAAGVVFAAVQTFTPSAQTPINVTVAMDPNKNAAGNMDIAKSGGAPEAELVNIANKSDGIEPSGMLDLSANGHFSAALNDGSEQKYAFRDLFDGRPDTVVTIQAPDSEINVLVDFGTQTASKVSGLVYTPPAGTNLATTLDVMVLPEGHLESAGQPVMSYSLQTSPGSQTFALPPRSEGRGLWLRVAGPAGADHITIGDFRVLR